jgi:uncharacterized membrane protein HdeD (DUF308 family)
MSATTVKTQAQPQPAQRPWWLTLVMGIAAAVIGGILLFGSLTAQARTYLLLVQLVGIWWLVDGIMNIIHMFTDHRGWGGKLIMGIIGILAGGWILIYPVYAALSLPRIFVLIIGIYGLFQGMAMLFMGFRGRAWGAVILGLIELIFGLILIANYDEAGWGLSLIWVAAIFAFVGGFVMIFRAFQERKA